MSETLQVSENGAKEDRAKLARLIILFSVGGLVVLSAVLIYAAAIDKEASVEESARLVFGSLLPLFGTWVGTILAFYFSRENFEAASKSVREMAQQTALGRRLRGVTVRAAMLPRDRMKVVEMAQGISESNIRLNADVLALLTPPITRVPVLDATGAVKYIIHQSMLYKFVADKTTAAAAGGAQFDVNSATLQDFLDHPGMRNVVEMSIAFVALDGTLADAKENMDRVRGCQDVFVTKGGTKSEPVEGWITNVDIEKRADV